MAAVAALPTASPYPFGFSPDFAWVVVAMAFIGIEYIVVTFMVGSRRTAIFTERFMEDNFGSEHNTYFQGEKIGESHGSPDMGCGRYAAKLGYREWVEFNRVQRTHYNFLENLPGIFFSLFLSGLYFPRVTAAIGFLYVIARFCYVYFYNSARGYAHPFRQLGSVIGLLSNMFLWGAVLFGAFYQLNAAQWAF